MLSRVPAAYLRRSYVDADSPGDISRDAQQAAIRKLAHADGHNGNLVEYDDWGVSADVAKSAKRTAYTRLLTDMEAGRIEAVYAFDVDRLYRDPRDLIRLQDAALRHAVRIVTTAGPLPINDGDDPAGEAFAFMGAVFGRMELQKIKKRNRAARMARQARGDKMGHPRFGFLHKADESGRIVEVPDPAAPLAAVLAAYKDAGSVSGACGLLEERGIPAPRGGTNWSTSTLTRVITANWPDLLPRKAASGRRVPPATGSVLAQLVACPYCGKMLTPNRVRRQLYCHRGHIGGRATHPRYVAREDDIMEFVRVEAARLQVPGDDIASEDDGAAQLEAIAEDRRRLGKRYQFRELDDDEYEAAMAELLAREAEIEESSRLVELPQAIDWSAPSNVINETLRAMWRAVILNGDMKPIEADWRRPEWRR